MLAQPVLSYNLAFFSTEQQSYFATKMLFLSTEYFNSRDRKKVSRKVTHVFYTYNYPKTKKILSVYILYKCEWYKNQLTDLPKYEMKNV